MNVFDKLTKNQNLNKNFGGGGGGATGGGSK